MNRPTNRFLARGVARALTLCLALVVLGCGSQPKARVATSPVAPGLSEKIPAVVAEAWPEADALFRSDPDWLGGDGAFSIDLGGDRTLWLFGDSLIATTEARVRRESVTVRNSVAIQTGRDPARGSIKFSWRTDSDNSPSSFFPEEGEAWFWPAHGVYVGNHLTIFLYRIGGDSSPGSLGFRVLGWTAVRVEALDADPLAWQIRELDTPDTNAVGIVGAAIVRERGHVYAYVVREPGNHDILLLRWTESEFAAGDLMSPEWWGGAECGWGDHAPAVVMQDGATEFSISRVRQSPYLVQVQSHGFGAGNLALRFAPELVGTWSRLRDAYRPPEVDRPGQLLYAGKAHPHLEGADLVATYVSNAFDVEALMDDTSIYFPRFVRINFR